jgi:uncharacterized RDD family membrane protein YckC
MYFTETTIDLLENWKILVNLAPTLIGLSGAIVFAASNFKKSGLLKFYMCDQIIQFPMYVFQIYVVFDSTKNLDYKIFSGWPFIISLITTITLTIFSCWSMWLLTKKQQPVFKYITIDDTAFAEFSPAPGGLRFVNRLIDSIFIFYFLYFNIIENYYFRNLFRGTGFGALFLVELSVGIYYYLILEGIFGISMGKIVTSTMVVDNTGKKPYFGNILGRTLCRFIPFDALSFLGKENRGWHDSFSDTYVVKAKAEQAAADDEELLVNGELQQDLLAE